MILHDCRLCNTQGYYKGRLFTATGHGGVGGVTSTSKFMTQVIAEKLGGTYKFKRTRGCAALSRRYPKPKNTIGLVS